MLEYGTAFNRFFQLYNVPEYICIRVKDLDRFEMPMASGIINTMIVGGAIIPLLMGWFTDSISVRAALIVPVVCYIYIVFFALKGSKIR